MKNIEILHNVLNELLETQQLNVLKMKLNKENPANISEYFETLDLEKQLFVFRLLTKDMAADVFALMDLDLQQNIINAISDNEIRNIVDEMFIDDTIDFLSEVPANMVTRILKNTYDEKRLLINEFLNYKENSAGSLMTIEFSQFHEDITVKKAMEELKKTGLNKETIYTCYVTDEKKILVGIIALRKLIMSDDDIIIKNIMVDNVISVTTADDQEYIATLFKKYNLIALPVVDKEKRLVGIITIDDIVDVIDQENTEDIEKMSALLPSEDEYLKTNVLTLAKNSNEKFIIVYKKNNKL